MFCDECAFASVRTRRDHAIADKNFVEKFNEVRREQRGSSIL
jgi:hypothetical protein